MKTFKQFLKEEKEQRVYRIDGRGSEEAWRRNDYAVINDRKGNKGTAPLPKGHNIKAGGTHSVGGHNFDVEAVHHMAFATPHRPNAFYAAVGRTAGPNKSPVKGAAVYDEKKMFGKKRTGSYKGEIHMTKADYDAMPEHTTVHSASAKNWKTEDYSGKDEVTSKEPATDTRVEKVETKKLVHDQYHVVLHPNTESIKAHLDKVRKESPHLSVLDQT